MGVPELPQPTSSKSLGLAGAGAEDGQAAETGHEGLGAPVQWKGQVGHRSQSLGLDLPAHPGPPAGPPGPALGHCCWRELDGRVPNSY